MSKNGRDSGEKIARETDESEHERMERQRALIEQVHHQAWEEYLRNPPPSVQPPKGVHYTELPEAELGKPLADEWNTYRREVGRLLAEGHEGRYVLIKGDMIIGIYDTDSAAAEEGAKQYLLKPHLVHPIRTEEPYLRIRGINYPWPTSRLQLFQQGLPLPP